MPTRRAFLMAAGALVVGAGGGGACGYSLGVAARPVEPVAENAPKQADPLPTSGDAELDYWRGVARGPLDELFEKGLMFMHVRVADYPRDEVLWQGVERMVLEIQANSQRAVPEAILVSITAQIEGVARPAAPSLREFVPMLRQRRQALRKGR